MREVAEARKTTEKPELDEQSSRSLRTSLHRGVGAGKGANA